MRKRKYFGLQISDCVIQNGKEQNLVLKSFRNPQSQIRNGFTLVELLIAVAISGIVFLSVISAYFLTLKTLDAWKQRKDDYFIARNIFRRMFSEVSSIYFVQGSGTVLGPEEKTDYKGLEGSEKSFSFYSTSKSLYFPFACLMKITYKFASDEGKGLLIREEEPIINFPAEEDKIFKAYFYSDKLKDFNFQYSDGKDWHDNWNIERSSQTLEAVKIKFSLSDGETFSTVIYIPTKI